MKSIKKIVSLVLTAAMLAASAVPALAADEAVLSDTTWVNVDNTSADAYAKPSSAEYNTDKNYYMHLATPDGGLELHQTYTEALSAGTYTFAFKAKGTGGMIFYSNWSGEWFGISADEGTDLGNGWKQCSKTVEIDGNGDSKFLLIANGAIDLCIDDISMTDANGKEYLADGGFKAVADNGGVLTHPASQIEGKAANRTATVEYEAAAENTYSLHMYTTGAQSVEISQSFTQPLTEGTYTLTWYAKGSGKLWYYNRAADGNWKDWAHLDFEWGTEYLNGWSKFSKELAVDADGVTNFLIYTDGAVDLYLDDISLVDANGVNYVIDGGFSEVTVQEDEPVIPDTPAVSDVKLTLSTTTSVNVPNTDSMFAKISDEAQTDGGYSLHFKTDADYLEASQALTAAATAGNQYVITADVKPVSGMIYFRVGWDGDDGAWMAISADAIGTELGNGFMRFQKVVTMKGDQNTFIIHNSGATEFYIDNVSLKPVDSEEELLPDGGFAEVIATAEVDMGEYEGKAWDVIINDFDGANTYSAKFTDGESFKEGDINFANVEADGGSIAFAIFLHTSRANATLDVVTK